MDFYDLQFVSGSAIPCRRFFQRYSVVACFSDTLSSLVSAIPCRRLFSDTCPCLFQRYPVVACSAIPVLACFSDTLSSLVSAIPCPRLESTSIYTTHPDQLQAYVGEHRSVTCRYLPMGAGSARASVTCEQNDDSDTAYWTTPAFCRGACVAAKH